MSANHTSIISAIDEERRYVRDTGITDDVSEGARFKEDIQPLIEFVNGFLLSVDEVQILEWINGEKQRTVRRKLCSVLNGSDYDRCDQTFQTPRLAVSEAIRTVSGAVELIEDYLSESNVTHTLGDILKEEKAAFTAWSFPSNEAPIEWTDEKDDRLARFDWGNDSFVVIANLNDEFKNAKPMELRRRYEKLKADGKLKPPSEEDGNAESDASSDGDPDAIYDCLHDAKGFIQEWKNTKRKLEWATVHHALRDIAWIMDKVGFDPIGNITSETSASDIKARLEIGIAVCERFIAKYESDSEEEEDKEVSPQMFDAMSRVLGLMEPLFKKRNTPAKNIIAAWNSLEATYTIVRDALNKSSNEVDTFDETDETAYESIMSLVADISEWYDEQEMYRLGKEEHAKTKLEQVNDPDCLGSDDEEEEEGEDVPIASPVASKKRKVEEEKKEAPSKKSKK